MVLPVAGSHHDAVRIQGIGDRVSFAQEFGIAGHAEADVTALFGMYFLDALAHQRLDQVSATYRHRGFVHDHVKTRSVHGPADASGGRFQIGQIRLAAGQGRSSHGNKNHIALSHDGVEIAGEIQTAFLRA